eukprot:8794567-Heterocapsa_arctica.AAC.1
MLIENWLPELVSLSLAPAKLRRTFDERAGESASERERERECTGPRGPPDCQSAEALDNAGGPL